MSSPILPADCLLIGFLTVTCFPSKARCLVGLMLTDGLYGSLAFASSGFGLLLGLGFFGLSATAVPPPPPLPN